MYIHGIDNSLFDYSLLLTNSTVSCNPDTTTGIKKTENKIQVLFYPNPVQDKGLLQIFTDKTTKVTIDIVDLQGRTLQTFYSGDITNGSNTFNIDTKALSSGLYLIIVNTEESPKIIKFLKYE